jgi:hypothetical protein
MDPVVIVTKGRHMAATRPQQRPNVDTRLRNLDSIVLIDPNEFWRTTWVQQLERHGKRACADATRLGLQPLALKVGDQIWTVKLEAERVALATGQHTALLIELDQSAFSDWVQDQRSALGLLVAQRVKGDPASCQLFGAWDTVLRSILDGRPVYQSGEIALRAPDGSALNLDQTFQLNDDPLLAAHFLAETGFLILKSVFTEEDMAAMDTEFNVAVGNARPGDGDSWWAVTRSGERYPCRILNLTSKSPSIRRLLEDPAFLLIGQLLGNGHLPGDPFGEHFSDPSVEGLVKRVDSVEGLSCLPWHKDCGRGGHSLFCSGLTVGICLTPVDEEHGGLDFYAGSHRSNIAQSQIDAGLDLPLVKPVAARGDVTVHLSCTLHRSTHPSSKERRVIYAGFALPPRPGDHAIHRERNVLERERAAIGHIDALAGL